MEGAIFCSYWNRHLTLDTDLSSLPFPGHLNHHRGIPYSIAADQEIHFTANEA